jgi:hypothetical protein
MPNRWRRTVAPHACFAWTVRIGRWIGCQRAFPAALAHLAVTRMINKDTQFNHRLALLVLASFLVFAFAVVLRVGLGSTPYDTTDSAGRPMGFNDPLHAEHYLIMVRNFHPTELLKQEFV